MSELPVFPIVYTSGEMLNHRKKGGALAVKWRKMSRCLLLLLNTTAQKRVPPYNDVLSAHGLDFKNMSQMYKIAGTNAWNDTARCRGSYIGIWQVAGMKAFGRGEERENEEGESPEFLFSICNGRDTCLQHEEKTGQ